MIYCKIDPNRLQQLTFAGKIGNWNKRRLLKLRLIKIVANRDPKLYRQWATISLHDAKTIGKTMMDSDIPDDRWNLLYEYAKWFQ